MYIKLGIVSKLYSLRYQCSRYRELTVFPFFGALKVQHALKMHTSLLENMYVFLLSKWYATTSTLLGPSLYRSQICSFSLVFTIFPRLSIWRNNESLKIYPYPSGP